MKPNKSVLIHRNIRFSFAVLSFLLFSTFTQAGLKIYFIRHGEAGHNVVKEWKSVPKDQWPAYVGNPNMFTPKGEEQAIAAAEKLKKYHYDFIAVSPAWRTMHTILPYLKLMGVKGELWPELYEFGSGASDLLSPSLPAPSKRLLNAGGSIQIPSDELPYFTICEEAKNKFILDQTQEPANLSADIRCILQSAIARIHKQFGGSDKSILLVGHGNNGKDLLKLLLNNNLDKAPAITNTGIWMVEEQPNGTFKLKIYNDKVTLN